MGRIFAPIVIAACLTQIDVKNNVCWALCRHDGADTGYYQSKEQLCICGWGKPFSDYTDTVIKITPKQLVTPPADEPWKW